jgi:hypothetical protein
MLLRKQCERPDKRRERRELTVDYVGKGLKSNISIKMRPITPIIIGDMRKVGK